MPRPRSAAAFAAPVPPHVAPGRTSTMVSPRTRPGRGLALVAAGFLVWLVAAAPGRAAEPAAPLRTAAGVRGLSATAAASARPVQLEGVILSVGDRRSFVLQDATDGIYVTGADSLDYVPALGDRVVVRGASAAGGFAPTVSAESIRRLGRGSVPPPQRVSIADVVRGGFDARWIELEGIVRRQRTEPLPGTPDGREATFLTLALGELHLVVRVQHPLPAATVVDARVRVRGVCFNVHNANRQFVRASLFVPGARDLVVLSPPPADPFALPLRRASELLQFDPAGFDGHRVLVRGLVTRHDRGRTLWIRDGDRGLQIDSPDPAVIAPGDEVEVAGFVDRGPYSPRLGDAVVRRRAPGSAPAPVPLGAFAEAVAHEANLVRVDAALVGLRSAPEGTVLDLAWDGKKLAALLPAAAGAPDPRWEPGARLRLTGICSLSPVASAPSSGLWSVETLQLLLRDATDLVVLTPAPWWNSGRLTGALATIAALLAAILAALWFHSRRQLGQRELARKMAEAEFSAILGERNRVARDIHDTLAQGLNAVSMQLELAKNAAAAGPDAALTHVATAHTIVRSCIAEARESIWNMRSHILERTDLAGALGQILHRMSAGLPVQTSLAVTGPPRRLAPLVENELLRLGQEGISNTLKHSGASHLDVHLEFAPGQVVLRVVDDGRGFDPAAAARHSSRFGLRGIRERAARLDADVRLVSAPGRGTELQVTVPLPDTPEESDDRLTRPPPSTPASTP